MWIFACFGIVSLLFIANFLRELERVKKNQPNPKSEGHVGILHAAESWIGLYVMPASYEDWLEKRLSKAGKPKGMDAKHLFFRQCLCGMGFLLLGMLIPQRGGFLFVLFFGGIGFLFPLFQLQSPLREREKDVRNVVRNWLLLLIPLLEGNLHFQSTVFDIFRQTPGNLKEEVNRVMIQVAGGRSLRVALWDAAQRVQGREFVQLVRVLIDGDRYGSQEMAAKLKDLKIRMDRHDRRRAKKQIKDAVTRLFFVVLLFIFVPMLVLGFLILMQSLKQNVPL